MQLHLKGKGCRAEALLPVIRVNKLVLYEWRRSCFSYLLLADKIIDCMFFLKATACSLSYVNLFIGEGSVAFYYFFLPGNSFNLVCEVPSW